MIGTRLANRYEILKELGRGGMGVVYLAHDPVLERDVAVKVVMQEHISAETAERFKREARVVAKMDHPAIVSVYDSGEHEGALFFVMPLVDGTNLRNVLRHESLRLGELIDIGIQVAEALHYSHSLGIIHRDIKPENVMITRRDEDTIRVRVTDFGLAMAPAQDRLTKTATIVGTVAYMSPEQVMGREIDSRSDIYSLATVLYESLVGQTPFSGEVQAMLYRISHEIPMTPRSLIADLDDEVEALLMSCLEKDPALRPNGKELADTLTRYRRQLERSGRNVTMLPTASALSLQYHRPVTQRPFVGRDKEFSDLQRRLNAAVTGECQFVLVAGEAGIGKTRLLEELEKLAKARQIAVYHGRFSEVSSAISYQGYGEVIQEFFRSRSRSDTPADFSDLSSDLISLFPVLAEMKELSVGSGASDTKPDTKKFDDRAHIFELLARSLTRMAAGKPMVLVLEDLHGADASIEALDYIVRRLGPTPTLIVGTYRTTEVDKRHRLTKLLSAFKADRRFALIQLGPLSPSGHRTLLEQLMASPEIDEQVARKFYEATEGNPYFTNELVHSLIDSGGLIKDDTGAYKLSSETAISIDEMPVTIQQTVEERIERLPEPSREILSIASVLGRTFEFDHLQIMAADEENIEESVEQLIRSGFLEEDRQSRTNRLSFSSGVVRDVLYASLPRLRRRGLHKKYAAELEKRNQGRLERVYGSLFEHYSQADVPDKVLEYGFLLARKSLQAFSPDDAVRILQTVLDFLEYEEASDLSVKGSAKELLAAAHRMKGNTDASMKALEEAISIFEKAKNKDRLLSAVSLAAEVAWQGLKVQETNRWVEKGIDLASAVGNNTVMIQLLSLGATVANLRGEYQKAREFLTELERLKPAKSEIVEEIPQGGTLSVALPNPFRPKHPASADFHEEVEVLANVFETLIVADTQGNLLPHLCERWETLNEGAMFLFVLRKEVSFHDGRKLTAKEVKTSFETAIRNSVQTMIPAFAAITGVTEFLNGSNDELTGIVALSDNIVQIQLQQRLPIYPALLTDSRTALAVQPSDGMFREGALYGTGPFKLLPSKSSTIVLERYPSYWKGKPASLDAIEFHPGISPAEMADGFRSGKLDMVRDILPQDLDEILRDPRLRATLVEAPQKDIYLVLFNQNSPVCRNAAVRHALTKVVPLQDLVLRNVARFAQPAYGLLPPGILGHDPGKRRTPISKESALEMLESSDQTFPIKLRAAVHPLLQEQYSSFTDSLFNYWSDLGVHVSIVTPTLEQYNNAWLKNEGIDLLIGRWIADYDDPDTFTFALFHSEIGEFRNYYCSPEVDQLMVQARLERQPENRERMYRGIEDHFLDTGMLLPLFHDIDYRVANHRIGHLTLSSAAPFVNYETLVKKEGVEATPLHKAERGILRIELPNELLTLDPAPVYTLGAGEALSAVFETLTRAVEGAQIIPWLASSFRSEEKGKKFRVQLRDGIRFHDGRRLTSRDVRYSFERILQDPMNGNRWLLSFIRGAEKMLSDSAAELEGFRILSAREFVIEFDQAISFFPAVLTCSALAIVPEGTKEFRGTWREGCVGTGPFRIAGFDSQQILRLEANSNYWRTGYPKSEGIEFHFGLTTDQTLEGFKNGRLSIVRDIVASEAEPLLQQAEYAEKFQAIAGLWTATIAFNHHKPPFSDETLRHKFCASVDLEALLRRQSRRYIQPAHTFTPPTLLGYEPPKRVRSHLVNQKDQKISLSAVMSHNVAGLYGHIIRELVHLVKDQGFAIEHILKQDSVKSPEIPMHDLAIIGWLADYPDADGFLHTVLHSRDGFLGGFCGHPELDVLIEKGRTETDPALRQAIYRDAEEFIYKHAIAMPLFHIQNFWFARPEVEGLELNYCTPNISYEKLYLKR